MFSIYIFNACGKPQNLIFPSLETKSYLSSSSELQNLLSLCIRKLLRQFSNEDLDIRIWRQENIPSVCHIWRFVGELPFRNRLSSGLSFSHSLSFTLSEYAKNEFKISTPFEKVLVLQWYNQTSVQWGQVL